MNRNLYASLMLLTAALSAASCQRDEWPGAARGEEGQILFRANRTHILTRAGESADAFSPGTLYRLFALQTAAETDYDWGNAKLYNRESQETDEHLIDYYTRAGESPLSYASGEHLDFYAVTYGTSATPPTVIQPGDGGTPVVRLALDDGGDLPDLLHSNKLRDQTVASGLLVMDFEHALSKVTFEISRQEEPEGGEQLLTGVRLKKIVLKGGYREAEMNLVTGAWQPVSEEKPDRTFYEDSEGMAVPTTPQTLTVASTTDPTQQVEREMLLFPNEQSDGTVAPLTVEVTLSGLDADHPETEKTCTYQLTTMNLNTGSDPQVEPFRFTRNHKYRLSIVVLRNDVRIIAISPQIYDWIDTEVDSYLGQPITFGGIMWMDRNLGATSADCQNDWFGTVGYYYQFARNIPYILDMEKVKRNDKGLYFYFSSDKEQEVLYTYDDKGLKVSGQEAVAVQRNLYPCYNASGMKTSVTYNVIPFEDFAINPGDKGYYAFANGNGSDWTTYAYKAEEGEETPSGYVRLTTEANGGGDVYYYTSSATDRNTFWEDTKKSQLVENHPCPKGWRLPTPEDLYAFMPEPSDGDKIKWVDSGYAENAPLRWNKYYFDERCKTTDIVNNMRKTAPFGYSFLIGPFLPNPNAAKDELATCPLASERLGHVYGIKYRGDKRAYRIHIEQVESNATRGSSSTKMRYVRISRFNALPEDRFEFSEDSTKCNLHSFDWNHPVEVMELPLVGYIDPGGNVGIADFGTGTIMRTSRYVSANTNYTLYLRNATNGVSVGSDSRRALGDPIRCVRDVTATD